jgi:amino acid transporter
VPFAFVATILIVTSIMTLAAAVTTGVLPDVAGSRTPIADASALLMGAAGGLLVSVGSVISMTGNNMGQLLSGSRSVYALAEHGDLPPVFARVHPVYRTPHVAIWFTTIVLVALALTGSFVFLAAVSAVARLVIYLSTCLATLWLRRPAAAAAAEVAPATFTVPLGPVIPVVASLITLGILAGATTQQLLAGLAALGAGALLYGLARAGVSGRAPAA